MTTANVIILDDDLGLLQMLGRSLKMHDMNVELTSRVGGFLTALNKAQTPYDLAIIDVMLPDGNGVDVCEQISKGYPDMMILMMTGSPENSDYVTSLELGADDYLEKPFNHEKFTAKVMAMLRRKQLTSGEKQTKEKIKGCKFGNWHVAFDKRKITEISSGNEMVITTTAYDLLTILLRYPNEILSRDFLMQELRGRPAGAYDRTIDVQVSRLRTYFGDDSGETEYFKTVHGKGYMLSADIETE